MQPISLYIHLPFCAKKCRYCDFYSVRYEAALADRYLNFLGTEAALLQKNGIVAEGTVVRTVFFGGGTPSILSPERLRLLCGLVRDNFTLEKGHEWTVECNPESFSPEKAAVLIDSGVTRLTFGFQSLDDRELAFLGRVHTAGRCRELLHEPALGRFASIGIDLMYGLPGQTASSIETSLRAVFESPYVKHISAYELTVADNTPFGRHGSLLPLPGDDAMTALSGRLWELLAQNGFERYEVSNFARPGHHCRHNEAYWDHAPYLGLGCAAHSYMPPRRFANVKDIKEYCSAIEAGELPRAFTETVDGKKLALEMVFLGLRRCAGINEEAFMKMCGLPFEEFVNIDKLALYVDQGLILYEKPCWKPTKKGLLLADAMVRALLF